MGDDRGRLVGVQRFDAPHLNQPLAPEQAHRVAYRDDIDLLLIADRDLLDRLLVELAAQADGGGIDLGPVAARDKIGRLMRQRRLRRP